MAAAASATDAAAFHQVGDQVYVRDAQFAWLPAVVLQVCDDRVLVRIELPDDWSQTTITSISDQNTLNLANQEQWVALKEYYNHCLPLQNNRICRDMAELDHLHEAEILYQIKHRHCVLAKPYTRVGDIIVSVNPCHWIPDLYSTERQQFYMENFANAYLNVGT
jgi:myosin heavy subunit